MKDDLSQWRLGLIYSKEFWRWCVTIRITGFLDFLHRPVSEISSLRSDLQLNCFIDSVIKSKGSSHLKKEQKPLGSVYIPYVKGVSESSNTHGIDTTLGWFSELKTLLGVHSRKPGRKETAQCIYSITCECGRSYIGETGRPLAVLLREHRHNLQQGLLQKSKLANMPMKRVIG
jgi:hypothetical protein